MSGKLLHANFAIPISVHLCHQRVSRTLHYKAKLMRNGSIEGITVNKDGEIKITGCKRPVEEAPCALEPYSNPWLRELRGNRCHLVSLDKYTCRSTRSSCPDIVRRTWALAVVPARAGRPRRLQIRNVCGAPAAADVILDSYQSKLGF